MMRLFLSDTCWKSLMDLPKHVKDKFLDFKQKFEQNPYGHNINLEKIISFKDTNLRTARLDGTYRVIVGVLENNDFCFLYVDHHDEAMNWAKNKRFDWNENISAFQIVPLIVSEESYESTNEVENNLPKELPLAKYSDEQLIKIGVQEDAISLVRAIKDYNELDDCHNLISEDVFERLFYLLDGEMTIEKVLEEIAEGKVNDISSANNTSRFIEITGDGELEEIINGDKERWQIFLHPSQKLLVEGDYKGSVKVTGGGGTGKTVAALHRLKHLCTQYPASKILFTSFTNTLIDNIRERIKSLGIYSSSVDVYNIDGIAKNIADKYNIIDNLKINFDNDQLIKAWKKIADDNAAEFSADFLASEYAEIIAYYNIKSEEEYRRVPRVGRGKPISPKQRKEIWKLSTCFKELRKKQGVIDRLDFFNKVSDYLKENNIHPYDSVIADEIQDFSNPELRFIRSLVSDKSNDLFLVGDPYQRVYNTRGINFGSLGINIKGKRSRRLKINYRTSEEIRRCATALVKGIDYDDFDGEKESLKGYLSLFHGDRPEYKVFESREKEIEYIITTIQALVESGLNYSDIAVGCQFKESLKAYQSAFHKENVPYKNVSSVGDKTGVTLSTLHNLKGLEFKVVIIADVNDRTYGYIPQYVDESDERMLRMVKQTTRSLMYVAITRAIQLVFITGVGHKPEELKSI